MSVPFWGVVGAYGLRDVMVQGWEKIVLDSRRFKRIKAEEPQIQADPFCCLPTYRKRPRTVFLICHSFYPDSAGGTEGFTLRLAQQLIGAGCRVLLFAHAARPQRRFEKELHGILYAYEKIEGISVIRLRHRTPPRGLLKGFPDDSAMTAFARAFLEREKPNVVHFTHLARLYGFFEACRETSTPYVVTLTDFFGICHYSTRIDRNGALCLNSQQGTRCAKYCHSCQVSDFSQRYLAARQFLYGAELLIAPSEYVAYTFKREFPSITVCVIPHGIDMPVCCTLRSNPVRRFGYVGQISEAKGIILLLKAFQTMPEDCTLDIYGSGNRVYLAKMRKLIKRDTRVRFWGALSSKKIQEVYQGLDCVVVPSLVPETYNFVAREALQSGCLVIASDIGALAEAVGFHANGRLFHCGDSEALLVAMQQAYKTCPVQAVKMAPTIEEEAAAYLDCYPVDCGGGGDKCTP